MKPTHLPPGTYRARVKQRRSSSDRGRSVVELGFSVAARHFAGQLVTGKFWSRVLIDRALSLHADQLVDIEVVENVSKRGKRFVDVKDFRPAGKPTVVQFVNGVCTSTGVFQDSNAAELRPMPLYTDIDKETLELASLEGAAYGVEPTPTPLIDSMVILGLNKILAKVCSPEKPSDDGIYEAHAKGFGKKYCHSMLVQGAKKGQRRLVPADETFARYARVDATVRADQPAHLSVFEYSDDLVIYQKAHGGSVAMYRGIVWGRRCVCEFDGLDGLADVLDPARYLVAGLVRLGVPREQVLVFYSGNRGLHVMFPSGYAGTAPQTNFEFATGQLCQLLVDQSCIVLGKPPSRRKDDTFQQMLDELGLEDTPRPGSKQVHEVPYDPRDAATWHQPIDWNMYKPNAMLRAPNTRHEKTGLYKVRLELQELMDLDGEQIKLLAKAPRPFEPPCWESAPQVDLCELWRYAVAVAHSRPLAFDQQIDGEHAVFGDTFDFMQNGAPEGTRANRLFRASVNLLQVSCPRVAVYQLLSPAALLSGMSPADIRAQIDGAVRYLRRPRLVHQGGTGPGTSNDHQGDER